MTKVFGPNIFRVLMLVGALATGACTTSVSFGNRTYAEVDDGLGAATAACAFVLAALESLEAPVVPDLRVVRPINPIIATNGLATRGIPADWMLNYMVRVSIIEIECIMAAIEKRNIAGKVSHGLSSTGLHEDPQGGVPVIYLYLPNERAALWIFASDTVAPIGVPWDPTISDPVLRYMDFLSVIERLVTL
ncbi:MAG: hypothetical protein HOB82_10380 [Alphaproteobacteria bacterium]|nr:hypothetical protein [Alphaproteobacteria bacterium]MBT4711913.1 hypothetical protein [Alphaproteobacteria bacterium]MBT5860620.1 hypothetical protein [Alphaproteobacteria bacterium]